ncbi:type II toxin-antitoxin system YafQ family toxin [Bifidobacterium sp. ESL0704]|uniref:type II toxin-antitoxin system YafQ family toxin n=1 Tax=Bifidobacterium sp. ESL0704 TaxID=2983219 RepID=UPI0023F6C478|nr:type II toxin-antitoxin system YafQ family toxin [Bifidobacterium sp. ESL0704]WEV52918.1 type II toxin-antitoxin system YafQ family toxin [Bifidobacterium sp. ESL0704]
MLDLKFSTEFDADLSRLARYDAGLAQELVSLMVDELMVQGCVPDGYRPHPLNNPGGLYNGCMEFHLRDDVLVLYSPLKPKNIVCARRICTHEELTTGHFGNRWPDVLPR